MNISALHLQSCLNRVAEVTALFQKMFPDAHPDFKSVDKLAQTIKAYCGVQNLRLLEALPKDIGAAQGMIIRKDFKDYVILTVSGLPGDLERYVTCKELFHIVLDDAEYVDMDIATHIDGMLPAFRIDDHRPPASVAAEYLGEIAAMEFLYPRARRLEDVQANVSFADSAKRFGVPENVVKFYRAARNLENLDPVVVEEAVARINTQVSALEKAQAKLKAP